jgi:hypothetical protein
MARASPAQPAQDVDAAAPAAAEPLAAFELTTRFIEYLMLETLLRVVVISLSAASAAESAVVAFLNAASTVAALGWMLKRQQDSDEVSLRVLLKRFVRRETVTVESIVFGSVRFVRFLLDYGT